ncbi:MAG: PAS domain S-box protein [Vicinamibacterales bacterium]
MADEPKPRILNVDDDDSGRYATSRVLARAGFDVIEAATGADTVRLAREQPDLVVLDVNLPDMSGFEVCRRIKTSPETAAIPVLHLSATYISPSSRADGLEGGADGYLVHPVDPRELVATVRALLRIRQTEHALRVSEERYRDLVENSRDMISTHDLEGRLLSVNAAAARMIGYPREALLRMNLRDLLAPSVKDRLEGYLSEIRTKGHASGVMQVCTAAGELRYWEFDNTLRTEGVDAPIVRATAHDVTSQKLTEAALRASEERFRVALETAAVGVALVAVDGRLLWVNQTLCDMLGYTRDELTALEWPAITHPDDVALSRRITDELVAGTGGMTATFEERYIRKDGQVVWGFVSTAIIRSRSGRPEQFITHVQDITRRKLADERVAHLNRVLRALRDINQLIVRENDAEQLLHEACRLLAERRGYDCVLAVLSDKAGNPIMHVAMGLEGKGVEDLDSSLKRGILPPCLEETRHQHGVRVVTDRSVTCASCPRQAPCASAQVMTVRLDYRDTVYGCIGVSVATGIDLDAEESALFADMASDIAFALYSIEQRKAMLQAEKEREYVEAELRQAQKMEAVGRLAGGVAHDFNNMLSVILGYAEAAMESLDRNDPLYADLREIKNAGERSADLTRQLLAFSRKQIVEPRAVSLNAVVADQQKLIGRLIGEDIEIRVAGDADLWPVLIDPSQVIQVLANLAVNARDAIEGVGSITIETSNVTLDESSAGRLAGVSPGDYVMLRFSDTGSGMTPEVLEHVFEPFFTTKEQGQGTGLGLSTVYGIVKQNNGAVRVESSPGQGTTFTVYWPRYRGESESAVSEAPRIAARPSETLLIVEDEEQVLRLARRILEARGYRVMVAATAGQAILVSETYPKRIDLLVTDVVMGDMNGKELQERLKAQRPELKTLFMSGYTADIIANRGVLDTGVDFIQKPFSPAALAAKVRAVLDS